MKTGPILLAVDAVINLLLGLLLLFFPAGILELFTLPQTNTFFYSSILGGVIFGIGIALSLEILKGAIELQGLGLAGAIAINLSGGGILLFWLIFGNLVLPLKGLITLWIVAILVIGVGLLELVSGAWKDPGK